jgi:hypothetical protein
MDMRGENAEYVGISKDGVCTKILNLFVFQSSRWLFFGR